VRLGKDPKGQPIVLIDKTALIAAARLLPEAIILRKNNVPLFL